MEIVKILKKNWKYIVVFASGLIFAILCFIGLNAVMHPTSEPEFCGSQCHEMKDVYRSWELSVHGSNKYGIQVGCINCHLPSKEDEFFTHLFAKAYSGGKDAFMHYIMRSYDAEKARAKAVEHTPDKRCIRCHSNLLAKPGSQAARKAHVEYYSASPELKEKCIDCHEGIAHERQNKLFSPDK